jgi:hypothetical protein
MLKTAVAAGQGGSLTVKKMTLAWRHELKDITRQTGFSKFYDFWAG